MVNEQFKGQNKMKNKLAEKEKVGVSTCFLLFMMVVSFSVSLFTAPVFASGYTGQQSHPTLYTDIITGRGGSTVTMDDILNVRRGTDSGTLGLMKLSTSGGETDIVWGVSGRVRGADSVFKVTATGRDLWLGTDAMEKGIIVKPSGMVGIGLTGLTGVTEPAETLHVEGNALISSVLYFTGTGYSTYGRSLISSNPLQGVSFEIGRNPATSSGTPRDFAIRANSGITNFFTIKGATGRVGINNNDPQYTLDVSGDVRGTGDVRGNRLCIGTDCKSVWPTGQLSGSGGTNELAFFTGSTSLGSDTGLIYDSTNDILSTGRVTASASGDQNNVNFAVNTQRNTGIYASSGGSSLGISIGGLPVIYIDSTRIYLARQAQFISGSAGSPGISFYGDTNTGVYRSAEDMLGFSTGGIERMRIDNSQAYFSGNVGIGTTPSYKLDVSGDVRGTGDVRGNRLCIGSDCRNSWPEGVFRDRKKFVPLLAYSLGLSLTSGGKDATVSVGSSPYGVAYGGGFIWVTNAAGNTISKINPATGAVVQTITGVLQPRGILYDGSYVWAALSQDADFIKIDPSTGAILNRYEDAGAYGGITGIAFDGTYIWAANRIQNTVVRFNPATGTSTSISISGFPTATPREVAFDGQFIWVTNSGRDTVSKINPVTLSIVATVTGITGAQAITFDGSYIWVGGTGAISLYKIDTQTNTVVKNVAGLGSIMGLAFDGTHLYVSSYSTNTLYKIDVFNGDIRGNINLGASAQPRGIAYDGSHIWVVNEGLNNVRKLIV